MRVQPVNQEGCSAMLDRLCMDGWTVEDARAALLNLGYRESEIDLAIVRRQKFGTAVTNSRGMASRGYSRLGTDRGGPFRSTSPSWLAAKAVLMTIGGISTVAYLAAMQWWLVAIGSGIAVATWLTLWKAIADWNRA